MICGSSTKYRIVDPYLRAGKLLYCENLKRPVETNLLDLDSSLSYPHYDAEIVEGVSITAKLEDER